MKIHGVGSDSPEDIQRCLSCPHPRCNNCLQFERETRARQLTPEQEARISELHTKRTSEARRGFPSRA